MNSSETPEPKDLPETIRPESERESSVHQRFRDAHEGHKHSGLDESRTSTGVIWATDQAAAKGYYDEPHLWGNLGQGAPETTPISADGKDEPIPRPTSVDMTSDDLEYGPVAGLKELRAAVAKLYNEDHRQGMESQYTWENVCIVPGGRAGLVRIGAVLGNVYVGFYIPDYSAYSDMLGTFKNFSAVPTPLDRDDNYHLTPEIVEGDLKRGTAVFLASNPRNPTGNVSRDEELERIHNSCRGKATLVMDEFYSGYQYTTNCDGRTISSAKYVQDVNKDDVLIVDGMTKRFRLPGWRVCWVLGPKDFIHSLSSSGSFLDGGANVPLQKAAIEMLEPQRVRKQMAFLQRHFMTKRDFVVGRLREIGFTIKTPPEATFYIWLDLSGLPSKINNGLTFFEACLEEKVIVVPGIFFDLNPAHRRDLFDSPCHHYVRLSYGPKMETLKRAMDGIERVVKKAKMLEEKEFKERQKNEENRGR
ncbi:aminotransferase, classes I and II [Ascobolus immersus RN42]|uniref:Aminotransferase, classes I and II n=1 Tax=Ascobolus immersus RN42 TaxID=1160509 RepID=A0A3N4IF54_ASCIM|nr:aminotransferase, classes I and II [Ascobolus immersus RN42]